MFIGAAGQGQFSDRWGRKSVYQFNLLLFGIFTILGALAPTVQSGSWVARFIAGIGLGAEQPLAFAYAGEYSPKLIRGRILAIVHFIGGACVWPIAALFTLAFRDSIGWRGVWIVIGIGALVVWLFRFTLPESPRYLATHGRGKDALDVLVRLGIPGPKEPLGTDAASNTKSDPFAVVFSKFPVRVIAGMICFSAFFGVAIGLGTWLPNIMNEKGFTITKSLTYTFGMTLGGAVREPVHDVRARSLWPQDHLGLRVRGGRPDGDRVCERRNRSAAADRRLRHDLFHSGRRQLDADLRVRGVSHQCAGIGIWLGGGRRPARHRWHHPGDPLDPKRLGAHRGVRVNRDLCSSSRRCRSPSSAPRPSAAGSTR